jgi:hypothetical protein
MPMKTNKPKTNASGASKAGSSKKAAARAGTTIPNEVARALVERERLGSNCNWIFEVDYSINSKYPRFFVYSINARVTTGTERL